MLPALIEDDAFGDMEYWSVKFYFEAVLGRSACSRLSMVNDIEGRWLVNNGCNVVSGCQIKAELSGRWWAYPPFVVSTFEAWMGHRIYEVVIRAWQN